jgi:hypothetical protein
MSLGHIVKVGCDSEPGDCSYDRSWLKLTAQYVHGSLIPGSCVWETFRDHSRRCVGRIGGNLESWFLMGTRRPHPVEAKPISWARL